MHRSVNQRAQCSEGPRLQRLVLLHAMGVFQTYCIPTIHCIGVEHSIALSVLSAHVVVGSRQQHYVIGMPGYGTLQPYNQSSDEDRERIQVRGIG